CRSDGCERTCGRPNDERSRPLNASIGRGQFLLSPSNSRPMFERSNVPRRKIERYVDQRFSGGGPSRGSFTQAKHSFLISRYACAPTTLHRFDCATTSA